MKKDGMTFYNKAMKHYSNGNLEKALNICEMGISLGKSNSDLINLKGLLLYIEGELEAAEATWKISKEFNDDQTAKTYLIALEKDRLKKDMYDKALILYKELETREALELLQKCSESDFNFLNVNILMAECYLKQGEVEKAKVHLINVKEKDKNNLKLKEVSREIPGLSEEIFSKSNRKIIIVGASIAVILGLFIAIKPAFSHKENKNVAVTEKKEDKLEVKEATTTQKEETTKEQKVESEPQKQEKNWDELKGYIDNKDYEKIGEFLKGEKVDSLDGDKKALFNKGKELLDLNGVKYFYLKGTDLFNSKDFGNAIKEYEKAYAISEGNYLRPHAFYMMAASYENLNDNNKAIELYKGYLDQFKDGEYVSQVLYKLAMLNKEIDKNESKKYAQILRDEHSDSMYNNTNIQEILGN